MGFLRRRKKLPEIEAPRPPSPPPTYSAGPHSNYGASTYHEGGGYSHSHYGESNNYALPQYHVPAPLPPPPQYNYYIPAPQPSPPACQEPQQPWWSEQYVPPSPYFKQSDPPQPQPPFPPSYHFFGLPPQRTSVYPSSEEEKHDCMIM